MIAGMRLLPLYARRLPALALLILGVALITAACGGGDGPTPGAGTPVITSPTGSPGDSPTASPATPAPSPAPSPTPAGTPITGLYDLPILMFHDVSPVDPGDIYRAGNNVYPDDFAGMLDYLQCAGYTTITLAQAFDAVYRGAPLPEKPIILSFDDGYDNHFSEVFPRLKDRGMVGTFAIITGYVEAGGPYLTWQNIREMADAGMEIISHTATHIDLGSSADATVRQQIAESKAVLEERTGKPVRFIVYPSGEPFRSGTGERQAEVVAMLQEAGYEGGLLAGAPGLQDPQHPFEINRIRVPGGGDAAALAGALGGPACE